MTTYVLRLNSGALMSSSSLSGAVRMAALAGKPGTVFLGQPSDGAKVVARINLDGLPDVPPAPGVRLSDQEVNTILAALRTYQQAGYGEPANRPDAIHEIATNGDMQISMDDDGIEALCDRLNGGDTASLPTGSNEPGAVFEHLEQMQRKVSDLTGIRRAGETFERSKLAGYTVHQVDAWKRPNGEEGGRWAYEAPDRAGCGTGYATEVAAWQAADRHRMFGKT